MLLSIGGHTISVEGSSAERFLPQFEGFKPFLTVGAVPEWSVVFGRELEEARGKTLNEFVFKEIESECLFIREENVYSFVMKGCADGRTLVRMRYNEGMDYVEATECDNASAFRFSLWFAFSLLSVRQRLTFVHSSTIVFRGGAVLFLGESGTGKSTHTRLWLENIEGSHLLNDDSPVLAIENGRPMVYGSPWSGKTRCYIPYHFPLAAIVRLSQAPSNSIRLLSVPEAIAALQPSLPPALMQDESFADQLFAIISSTIKRVPAFHLACLPDETAARMSQEAVFRNMP